MKKRKLLAYFLVALMIVTSLNGTIHAQNQRASEKVELQNPRTDAEGNTIWDCVYFGNYWQNYANEKEPIKWRVLSVNGNDALLISDRIIEKGAFNETNTDCTWGNSTIRSWLNGYSSENNVDAKDYQDNNFLDEAFSEEEQEAILLSTVVNESNEEYGVIGEADTEDKVYLLSLEENARTEYGNETDIKDTRYVEYDFAGGVWTRSMGQYGSFFIGMLGGKMENGISYTVSSEMAIRPVLHLDMSKTSLWEYGGTVNSAGKSADDPKNQNGERDFVLTEVFGNYVEVLYVGAGGGDVIVPQMVRGNVVTDVCFDDYFCNFTISRITAGENVNGIRFEYGKEPIEFHVANPDCSFDFNYVFNASSVIPKPNVTIYGKSGGSLETFCKNKGYTFIAESFPEPSQTPGSELSPEPAATSIPTPKPTMVPVASMPEVTSAPVTPSAKENTVFSVKTGKYKF